MSHEGEDLPDSAHLLTPPIAFSVIEYHVTGQIAKASKRKKSSLHIIYSCIFPRMLMLASLLALFKSILCKCPYATESIVHLLSLW